MGLHFLTFGNAPWHRTVTTLCQEAKDLGIFETVRGFNEDDLPSDVKAYCGSRAKGYGYWAWKPAICVKILESAKDDDVFIYADAGCVFNPPAMGRLRDYATLVHDSRTGVLGFQMPPHKEIQWTKRELLRRLQCEDRDDILYSPQVEATCFVFTRRAAPFMNTWRFIAMETSLNIDNDLTIPQLPSFREHRNDQSIFSLLMKLHGGRILGWETWCWGDNESEYAMNPIWERRRKIATPGVYIPNSFAALAICDVVYNDANEYVLILEDRPINHTLEVSLKTRDGYIPFQATRDPDGMSLTFTCRYSEYSSSITIRISGTSKEYTLPVSLFPAFTGGILMSTLVWNEDAYVCQWIKYHKALGVDKFIIYDNVPGGYTVENALRAYIEDGTAIVIKWPFKWGRPNGEAAQQTQQTHTLHTFKGAKWIGFLDVDEYVNPQTESLQLSTILQSVLDSSSMKYEEVSGIRMVSRSFINSDNKEESGHAFLSITTCGEFERDARWKWFVNPNNVKVFSVHQVTIGLATCDASTDMLYFNHYRFLNKHAQSTGNYHHGQLRFVRGVPTSCVDDSIHRILDSLDVF